MIDVHAHILPGIDDGARDIEDTIEMIKEAEKAGFTDIITTSHYIENEYNVNKENRKYIIEAIQEELSKENIEINLYNGAEIYITNELLDLVEDGVAPSLAGSRYVLFELPLSGSKVIYIEQVIEDLIVAKYTPIIAHPERYDMVKDNPNVAVEWVKKGALLQSNYASIIERYGHKSKQTLLKLIDANAIHFLGTDTHRPNTIYSQMSDILEEFRKEIGEEKLNELTTINPQKITNNEKIFVDTPQEIKKRWFGR